MPARDIPVRQGSLREHNLAVVLRQVAAGETPVSRAAIAASSGLTRATVSAIVDELIAGGLVTFSDHSRNGVGRPAAGVSLAGAQPAGLGMEINVDYLATCVVDLAGNVRHREVVYADQRGRTPAQALSALAALAAVARRAVSQGLRIVGGAVALPGLVEGATVHIAPNLGWRETRLPDSLGDLPVTFGNEANLAAFGELHASKQRSFIYVSGEIGIGAGIVVNSEPYLGTRGWAGELGHVTVDPAGKPCRCGSQGCLEQYAGEDAIRQAAAVSSQPPPGSRKPTAAGGKRDPSALAANTAGGQRAQIAELAAAGDPATLAALTTAGEALGVALASAVNLLDLPAIVLGGHFAPLTAWLSPPIEAELRQRVLTARWSPPTIQPSVLGADATVIGAARTVTQAIIDNPAAFLASPRP